MLVEVLNKPLRIGYYTESVNFTDDKDSKNFDTYECLVHVEELDRYTNGDSKIKLNDVEIVSGFDSGKYRNARNIIIAKFSSIKCTKDIEWLESEESLKEQRKEKLKKITEKLNDK